MKVCETKTRTYKVVTGYEDGECKEIEVGNFEQFPFWAIWDQGLVQIYIKISQNCPIY